MPFKCACGDDVSYEGEVSRCQQCGKPHYLNGSNDYSFKTYWYSQPWQPMRASGIVTSLDFGTTPPPAPKKKTVAQQYHDLLKQANKIHGSKWRP